MLSPSVAVLGIVGGALAVVALGFIVVQLVVVQNGTIRQDPPSPSRRLFTALAVSLLSAVVVGQVIALRSSGFSFAESGQQRYISAPFVYGSFALIALATTRYFAPRWPLWLIGLLIVTVLSTLFSPLAGPRFTAGTLIQGLVLFGGTALFGICGLLDIEWVQSQQRRFLTLLLGVGTAAGVLGLATGIFSALVLPTAALLIYLAFRRVRLWPLLAVVGGFVVLSSISANADAVDPSAASTGQLVVAGGILALAALPRRTRFPVVVLAALGGLVMLSGSDVPGLFIGRGADLEDVTLAQRAYETQQVFHQISTNPSTLLFGAGPGATVDLTLSPDSGTLAGSGRVLGAVPSVHLLTSYVLLKTGCVGLIWLVVYTGAAGAAAVRTLRRPVPDIFDLALVVFVLCGITQAVPAATFLFSNPLPTLALAVLHIHRAREDDGTDKVQIIGLRFPRERVPPK